MSWRLAKSLDLLRNEVNAAYPTRSKVSDGTIGDQAHASTGSASDHNPFIIDANGVGVVRAFDITTDPVIGPAALAEKFRVLGKTGDARLIGGGYVIYNHSIASERDNWVWRPYTGSDPHTSHIHLSVSRNAAGYDLPAQWGVANTIPSHPDLAPTDEELLLMAIAKNDDDARRYFVRRLYIDLFHRQPESEAVMQGWIKKLADDGADALLVALTESAEGKGDLALGAKQGSD